MSVARRCCSSGGVGRLLWISLTCVSSFSRAESSGDSAAFCGAARSLSGHRLLAAAVRSQRSAATGQQGRPHPLRHRRAARTRAPAAAPPQVSARVNGCRRTLPAKRRRPGEERSDKETAATRRKDVSQQKERRERCHTQARGSASCTHLLTSVCGLVRHSSHSFTLRHKRVRMTEAFVETDGRRRELEGWS